MSAERETHHGMRSIAEHIRQKACRVVCVLGLLYVMMCTFTSCGWQEAKEVIAVADSLDQMEYVIYDDTAALGRTIRSLDNPLGRLLMSNTLGKAYYYMGRNLEDYHQQVAGAARCYIEADRLQIDDPIYRGRVNSCMGYICAQNNNDSLALVFYERASEDFKESGNEGRYAHSLLDRIEFNVKFHNYIVADSLLWIAYTYSLDSAYRARYYETHGLYFYEQQQYDSALVYFNQGLKYWQSEAEKSFSYLKIMQIYYFGKKDFQMVIPLANLIVENSNNPNHLANAYYCLLLKAKENNDINQLSQITHARTDALKLLRDNTNKYAEATPKLMEYVQNPHPWRWVWLLLALMIAMCGVLIAGILIYRKRTKLQLHISNEHIVELSTQLEKQENELNIACQKNHQTKMIDEIRIKYPTPPNKWNDYCRLKTDINPYLSTWLTALEELNLTNREKVLCTFIFLYPYLSAEELAKFMCMTKGGVQVIRTHVVKKVGITSTQLVDYLQEMSKEM